MLSGQDPSFNSAGERKPVESVFQATCWFFFFLSLLSRRGEVGEVTRGGGAGGLAAIQVCSNSRRWRKFGH